MGLMDGAFIGFAIIFIAMGCTLMAKKQFSMNVFLCAAAIEIMIVIWVGIFPPYMVLFSILAMIAILFGKNGGGTSE